MSKIVLAVASVLLINSCMSPQLLNPHNMCINNLNDIYKAAAVDNDLEYYVIEHVKITSVKKVTQGIYLTCSVRVLLKYKNHTKPIIIDFDFIVRLFNKTSPSPISGNANA